MLDRFKLKNPPSVQAVRVSSNLAAFALKLPELVGVGARTILLSLTSEGALERVAVTDERWAKLSGDRGDYLVGFGNGDGADLDGVLANVGDWIIADPSLPTRLVVLTDEAFADRYEHDATPAKRPAKKQG
jgi:hypothetical protein